jgi:hypothetical protein
LPLSDLTKLDLLSLGYNPSLTDKTCPVKPASTCRFVLEKDQWNLGYGRMATSDRFSSLALPLDYSKFFIP